MENIDVVLEILKEITRTYKEYVALQEEFITSIGKREQYEEFRKGMEPREFGIYQLRDTVGNEYRFRDTEDLRAYGLKVEKENYTLVYAGTLKENQTLEDDLEFYFNLPADFMGHLSVGDIVVLTDKEGSKGYYLDSAGFTELPDFRDLEWEIKRRHLAIDINRFTYGEEREENIRKIEVAFVSGDVELQALLQDLIKEEPEETERVKALLERINVSGNMEDAEEQKNLATDLDRFLYEIREKNIRKIERALANGNVEIQVWLQDLIDLAGRESEEAKSVKAVLERVNVLYLSQNQGTLSKSEIEKLPDAEVTGSLSEEKGKKEKSEKKRPKSVR